jgi:hypothetical protein
MIIEDYIGEIYGMVDRGFPISKEQTIQQLEYVKDMQSLVDIIRFSVGNFWLSVKNKNKQFFISSTSAPSMFFYWHNGNINYSQSEREIYDIAASKEKKIEKKRDSPFKNYHMHAGTEDPYAVEYTNVYRVPSAHVARIDGKKKITMTPYLYNQQNKNVANDYHLFKKTLEGTMKLYADSQKKLYVLFSGGIDSCILLLALQKFSNNVQPISVIRESGDNPDVGGIKDIIKIFGEKFGIKPIELYTNGTKKSERAIFYKVGKLLNVDSMKLDNFTVFCVMDKFKNERNSIFFAGTEFESYGLDYPKLFVSFNEFMVSPIKRVLNRPDRKKMIDRYYWVVPYLLKSRHVCDVVTNHETVWPAVEGPLNDFLINLKLTALDMFIPKRFMYKYFHECTGKSHILNINPLTVKRKRDKNPIYKNINC